MNSHLTEAQPSPDSCQANSATPARNRQNKLGALAARAAERKASTAAYPHVMAQPELRHEPFPLSDMQQAYWIGRAADLRGGGVAMQSYVEIECQALDLQRFKTALNALVERHEMLRAVVTPEGEQRVLPLPLLFPVAVTDMSAHDSAAQQRHMNELAAHMTATVSDLEHWPQSEVHFTRLAANPDGTDNGVLHFRWDMWATDGRSFQILYEDLAALYLDSEVSLPEIQASFRDYMLTLKKFEQSQAYTNSLQFWKEQLRTLPPAPTFPKPAEKSPADSIMQEPGVIKRYEAVLTVQQTTNLQKECARRGFSLTALLAAAYAEVISLYSGSRHFTLNMPRFNRNLHWHESINHIMGEFATFTLVPVDLTGDHMAAHAAALQKTLWTNLEHAEVSGVRLLREMAQMRGEMETEVMPVVFTAMPDRRADDTGVEKVLQAFGSVRRTHGSTPQTKLDCQYTIFTNALHIYWDGKTSVFPSGMVDDMFDEYMRILRLLADDPKYWEHGRIAALPLQQAQRRAARNNRPMPLPQGTVCDIFLKRAAETPEAAAIIAPDKTLTYAETLGYALLVRQRILEHTGASQPQPHNDVATVGIVLERGWQAIVCILGVQLAGMPYLPLDSGNPPSRLCTMLEAGRAVLTITHGHMGKSLAGAIPILDVDALLEDCPEAVPHSDAVNATLPDQSDPAYVMLTSGTTGTPKAVIVSHQNLLNLVVYTNERFALKPEDRIMGVTSLHHDLSVYDVFGTLAAGAALVILPHEDALRPDVWADTALRHNVTFWNSVPAFIKALARHSLEHDVTLPIRIFVAGGDWVEASLPGEAQKAAPDAEFYSIGGPTETTVWNIMHKVEGLPKGWGVIPYGAPIANNSYYILDEDLRDVPDWVTGEMYCAGANVCLDILASDASPRLIHHPETGERLYRTGDAGRYHDDGLIEILGRTDFQINIGGFRLDPVEVETVIARHPDVGRAVVIPVKTGSDVPGGQILGAFVLARQNTAGGPVDATSLQAWLQDRLPPAMLPRICQFVDELPLTANGKIDRRALIEKYAHEQPENEAAKDVSPIDDHAPQTPVECLLASLWQEVLHVEVTGVRSNFFRLGGDSLKAVQVLARLKEKLPVPLPLSAFFTNPTIEGLAKTLLTLIRARTSNAAGDTSR
ncbi:MAG: AMP-binding protein [Desulfovibrio sp.]|uniref:non-ribosomal peptide synthetase n=1 Tax=Desulfovibrio sp. TaxID=885 RepID=UPI0039E6BF09